MAVQPQTPYIEHVANGITNSFNLEFDCNDKDHLIVLVDDHEPMVGDWQLDSGALTFKNAPKNGAIIKVQRNTPFRRDRDYQSYDNSFRPPAVNNDFDWIWWKLQELGVADWILGNRINALKNYVDRKDDELKGYLLEEIRKQGVALDQLDDYYNYLMERLAQIAVDKGWDASFIIDGNENQKKINDKSLQWVDGIPALRGFKKRLISQSISTADGSIWSTASTGIDDGTMTVIANDGTVWKRGTAGTLRLSYFGNTSNAALAFSKLFVFIKTMLSSYVDNGQDIRKLDIDLEGKVWETSTPIFGIQGIGGVNFVNGHIKAKEDFVGEYLVEFTDDGALRAYHYISWNRVIIDGNRKTSCMKFNRFLKSGVTGCHFIRWKKNGYGLVVGKAPADTRGASQEGHEFYVNGQCSFAQYDFSSIWAGQVCSGTALYINTYDGHYSDFFIAYTGRGIEHIRTGLNIFDNIHIYGAEEKDYGFFIDCTESNPFINLVNIYMDECSIRALNPNQITITNSKIFRNDSSESGLIIFDTSEKYNFPKRIVVSENHVNTSFVGGKDFIQYVTDGGGTWVDSNIKDIRSSNNTILGFVNDVRSGVEQCGLMKWDGYEISYRYPADKSSIFTFDLKPFHNCSIEQNATAFPSEWLITSNWQSAPGSSVGAYRILVFLLSSGQYSALIEPIGVGINSTFNETTKTVTTVANIPLGFNSAPIVSNDGIITVNLAEFCRGAIMRSDLRDLVGIQTT